MSTSSRRSTSAYTELRDASGRSDHGSITAAAIAALRADGDGWGGRPVFVYGFDDLRRDQTELVAALAAAAAVTVAVTYADTRALAARAGLLARLVARARRRARASRCRLIPATPTSATLRHLDRNLFEPGAPQIDPDDGILLLDSAGARGEAEAIGIEIAPPARRRPRARRDRDRCPPSRLVRPGARERARQPRDPSRARGLDAGLAPHASAPRSIALCRAALDETALDALLTHLRYDPSLQSGRRSTGSSGGSAAARRRRSTAATERWEKPTAPPQPSARGGRRSGASAGAGAVGAGAG